MTQVKDLFKKREQTYETLSHEILEALPNVLEGCRRFIADRGADVNRLTWEGVSYLDDKDVILLMAAVTHQKGDVVIMPDGTHIHVNDENADEFKSMLHLGLPYKLAITGTIDDIQAFMNETLETDDHEVESAVTPDEIEQDFDLSELSEDQLNRLLIPNGGGKN